MARTLYSEEEENGTGGINLTPLIDMVFILLIFFMVTASFVKESGIDINRPAAQSAEQKERANIIIAIKKNGEVWIDRRQVTLNALRAHVERLHAENPEGTVIISADKEAPTEFLVRALDEARLAGVAHVAIATLTP
ncbi:ExbD/TolR family protein [Nitrosococcus oceani]|uniref:ExbD/TolR family protein n=1 Tax=Nitrosococcus oceani TaxID=1229 RepID=UPI0004E8CF3D|nr:biopolymer transporter ExbD [Nitrosococcus oceani]KFI23880.1 biopolymer transporter ExbD [Nitrosococcus oceani]